MVLVDSNAFAACGRVMVLVVIVVVEVVCLRSILPSAESSDVVLNILDVVGSDSVVVVVAFLLLNPAESSIVVGSASVLAGMIDVIVVVRFVGVIVSVFIFPTPES